MTTPSALTLGMTVSVLTLWKTSHLRPEGESGRSIVIAESGAPLTSLFSGTSPRPHSPVSHGRNERLGCSGSPVWAKLRSLFTPIVVQASHCGGGGGSCGGAWMTSEMRECNTNCSFLMYEFFYSDMGAAGQCDGWKYNTMDECGVCTCEEIHCNSCT